jgi:quinol monooxygenase YgiN
MPKSTKYGLHGCLTAKAGQAIELSQILLQAAELMKDTKGCQLYMVSVDKGQPNDIWVTEIWDSKTDHDASLQQEGVRELIARAMPLLENAPQKGQELNILGGLGVQS